MAAAFFSIFDTPMIAVLLPVSSFPHFSIFVEDGPVRTQFEAFVGHMILKV
jgi:hypothetical protein